MMKQLHCTYTELQDEPVLEMQIFRHFAMGEADEERNQHRASRDQEHVNVGG